jgi:hypothetical protein
MPGWLSSAAVPETLPPSLVTAVPGPRSRALARRLAAVESRNVTALAPEPPIFWERAAGANVWDADGNRYVDLGAGFGVANVGHAHPRVVEALAAQERTLLHAMGDVHPAAVKVALLEALAARFPGGGPARAVLGSSGSDAVGSRSRRRCSRPATQASSPSRAPITASPSARSTRPGAATSASPSRIAWRVAPASRASATRPTSRAPRAIAPRPSAP